MREGGKGFPTFYLVLFTFYGEGMKKTVRSFVALEYAFHSVLLDCIVEGETVKLVRHSNIALI